MPFVTVGRENTSTIRLHYEDRGAGVPVLLVHGYPLDARSWEKQESALLAAGHRVITYDRRGFGASSAPSIGYNYDTLAADLHLLLAELDLQGVSLAGFAMGAGEVIRYLAAYGSKRISTAALLAPVPPFLLRTADNPEGLDSSVFDTLATHIAADRPAAMKTFLDDLYNIDMLGGSRVSDQAWQASFYAAVGMSAPAALGCVQAWREDFRDDLPRIDVPVLILQGDQDRILPPAATGDRLPALIRRARHLVIQGGPHAITWTHADQVNQALLQFIAAPHADPRAQENGRPLRR